MIKPLLIKGFFMSKILFLSLLISVNAFSTTEVINLKRKVFKNSKCKLTDTCDLKEASFEFSDYKVFGSKIGLNFGSRLFSSYKTKKVSQLQNYVFVQFIQGCVFKSDGNKKYINNVRKFYGNTIQFKHRDIVIDSVDTDPVYNSAQDEKLPRHFFYRWNTKRNSYNINSEKLFGTDKPTKARLYIVDHPGGVANAQKYGDIIETRNLSFKLKTCLYKNSDVPEYLAPEAIDIKNPIVCYDWQSSYIFNHDKKLFESKSEIAPACLE